MQEFINLANYMADEAGEIIHRHFRTSFDVETKADETPVTIADRAVERALRDIIERQRPEDGILGEEYDSREGQSGYIWIFDPVDGTTKFAVGCPTFTTLISLWKDDTPLLGLIDQPISKERWLGVKGQKTTLNGRDIQTRPCASIGEAFASATTPVMFKDRGATLEKACKSFVWGKDGYAYGLLASGFLDAVAESDMGPYDYAAMPPIIEGAGGLMCDWNGAPLTLTSPKEKSRVLALGDQRLKKDMLKLLNA